MAYEDIFPYLGDFGPYQRRIYLLLCLPAVTSAFHKLAGVFLQARVPHRCRLPGEAANATYQQLPGARYNESYPWDAGAGGWDGCARLAGRAAVACDRGWLYDRSAHASSTVMEWDLVCGRSWLRALADSAFMLGDVLGSVSFGYLSDRFGRRPTFFVALLLQLVAGLLVAGAPSFPCFLVFRLLVGSTASGMFLVAYVIALELVGPSRRVLAGVACQLFFTTGYLLTAALAYVVPEWRLLQAALTLPAAAFLSYWWLLPESARWLLTRGRAAEARALLQRAAKENGVKIPERVLDSLEGPATGKSKGGGEASLVDIARLPSLRLRALNIFFNWFVNNSTYYGLSWNTSNLGGDDYLNFLIAGAVEVPAYTFLLLTLNRWGRKTILCGCMLLGGAALLATIAVPAGARWLTVSLAMLGKLAVTASYGTIYVFTAEQFPTVVRNAALGASSTCARAGGITAPYINLLGERWAPLPLLLFGLLISAGGLLALLLPETLHRKLPDTIEEGESFGRSDHSDPEQQHGQQQAEAQELRPPEKLALGLGPRSDEPA